MKVILKEDIFKLGSLGDEVEVKRGYARNYLIPQGKALLLTRANLKRINHQKTLLVDQRAKAIEGFKSVQEKIENAEVIFKMKSSESGKLFGSVTQKNIHDVLLEQDVEIDRKKIVLTAPIKALGSYETPVKLHTEVIANLKVTVVSESVEKKPSEEETTPEQTEEIANKEKTTEQDEI